MAHSNGTADTSSSLPSWMYNWNHRVCATLGITIQNVSLHPTQALDFQDGVAQGTNGAYLARRNQELRKYSSKSIAT